MEALSASGGFAPHRRPRVNHAIFMIFLALPSMKHEFYAAANRKL
jgi:hypothetical protein